MCKWLDGVAGMPDDHKRCLLAMVSEASLACRRAILLPCCLWLAQGRWGAFGLLWDVTHTRACAQCVSSVPCCWGGPTVTAREPAPSSPAVQKLLNLADLLLSATPHSLGTLPFGAALQQRIVAIAQRMLDIIFVLCPSDGSWRTLSAHVRCRRRPPIP